MVVNDDVLLLPGGCACCGMRSGLAEALLRLERGARRGELPPFERIVVETSGLAEPGAILQLFAESALLVGRFRVEAVVTVVDALLGAGALDVDGTGLRQVLLADRLVLTKWETLARDALQRLDSRLAQLNPFAERIRAPRGAADAAWLGHSASSSGAGKTMPAGAFRAAHDDAIESFALHWDHLEPLAGIGEWLHALAATHAGRMLRVKGIVAAADRAQAVAVHAVQHYSVAARTARYRAAREPRGVHHARPRAGRRRAVVAGESGSERTRSVTAGCLIIAPEVLGLKSGPDEEESQL